MKQIKQNLSIVILSVICAFLVAPMYAFAVTTPTQKLPVAVWLPYWKKASGTPELALHLDKVTEFSPFAYEVEDDGMIGDSMKLAAEPWVSLIGLAKEKKVKVVPTVLWLHGNAIHQTLSSTSTRQAHVEDILSMVDRNGFDGIDIDYENKIVDTRYYFSRFLRELSEELHLKKKLLVCTIEPRTPVSSLFKVPPKSVERANDYVFINKYCDSVRLMTYDQATADLLLNKSKGDGVFYAPVADSDWVKKVIGETTKTISKKKIMLGVATYGYEYLVDTTDRDNPVYTRLRAIGNDVALQLASSTNSKVFTNVSGEKSFAYTDKGQIHFITWSDADAIQSKVKISKQYGLKGVAIFKIDGEGDKNIWSVLR